MHHPRSLGTVYRAQQDVSLLLVCHGMQAGISSVVVEGHLSRAYCRVLRAKTPLSVFLWTVIYISLDGEDFPSRRVLKVDLHVRSLFGNSVRVACLCEGLLEQDVTGAAIYKSCDE